MPQWGSEQHQDSTASAGEGVRSARDRNRCGSGRAGRALPGPRGVAGPGPGPGRGRAARGRRGDPAGRCGHRPPGRPGVGRRPLGRGRARGPRPAGHRRDRPGRLPGPSRHEPHGAGPRGVRTRPVPDGARSRRAAGGAGALRHSPHPGLRQLAGGPGPRGPRPAAPPRARGGGHTW
ncbi:hypothetical protein SGPA1_50078 [Streptomyces misionensis JCM 4497]